ncbi:Zn-ribbon domain-containing OB-fold protein [Rhodococcus sp. B50]|uniref:Zn-ribbon domain-containing OB-fold protein n=1 Tax=Rhodococcus sp. B50 TaxID=2682847 RepID=UPI0027DCB844|nr:OB-fold domain-containing protein [Rhodococcus sp. B50]
MLAPSTTTCHGCGSDILEPIDAAGAGVIVSCRVVDGAPDPLRGAPCPSVLAIIELDEGPWVYSWIDGEIPFRPDCPVRVSYRSTQPGQRFPSFELRDR